MKTAYLQLMGITNWHLRNKTQQADSQCFFAAYLHVNEKQTGVILAEKTDDGVAISDQKQLLAKIANALSQDVIITEVQADSLALDDKHLRYAIFLGESALSLGLVDAHKNQVAVVQAENLAILFGSPEKKKKLWLQMKPLKYAE